MKYPFNVTCNQKPLPSLTHIPAERILCSTTALCLINADICSQTNQNLGLILMVFLHRPMKDLGAPMLFLHIPIKILRLPSIPHMTHQNIEASTHFPTRVHSRPYESRLKIPNKIRILISNFLVILCQHCPRAPPLDSKFYTIGSLFYQESLIFPLIYTDTWQYY